MPNQVSHLPLFRVTSGVVNYQHNYVAQEHHYRANVRVTRKGAIRAREGDLGIEPGSMGQHDKFREIAMENQAYF